MSSIAEDNKINDNSHSNQGPGSMSNSSVSSNSSRGTSESELVRETAGASWQLSIAVLGSIHI